MKLSSLRLLSIALILCFTVATLGSTYAFAVDSTENDVVNFNTARGVDSLNRIAELWNDASAQIKGTTDYSDSATYIGEAIPTYEVTDAGIEKLPYLYYPLIESEKIVALAIIDIWEDGTRYATLSFDLLDNLQEAYLHTDEVALIYTREGLYFAIGNELKLVYKNTTFDETRAELTSMDIHSIIADGNLDQVPLAACMRLDDYTSSDSPNGTAAKNCMVDVIKQKGNFTCWACTAVSIGEYITESGMFETGEDLCYEMFGNYDQNGGYSVAGSALYQVYILIMNQFRQIRY